MIIAVVIFNILGGGNNDDTSGGKSKNTSVTDNASENKDTEVPNLVGKFFEHTKEQYQDYFILDPTYEYNDDYDNDMIFEQETEAGTMIASGSVVKVKVSKGKESAIIPDFSGCTVSQYKNRLEAAGISDFNYQFLPSTTYYGEPNSIIELQVDGKTVSPGTFFSNKEGKKLTVYYVSEDTQAQTTQPPATDPEPVTTAAEPETTTSYIEPTTQPPIQTNPPPTDAPVTDAPVTDVPPEYGEW